MTRPKQVAQLTRQFSGQLAAGDQQVFQARQVAQLRRKLCQLAAGDFQDTQAGQVAQLRRNLSGQPGKLQGDNPPVITGTYARPLSDGRAAGPGAAAVPRIAAGGVEQGDSASLSVSGEVCAGGAMTLGPGLRRTQSVGWLPVLSKIPRRVGSASPVSDRDLALVSLSRRWASRRRRPPGRPPSAASPSAGPARHGGESLCLGSGG